VLDLGVKVIVRRAPTTRTPKTALAGGISAGLAGRIRERVRDKGEPVQRFPGYSQLGQDNKKKDGSPQYSYTVSPAYPVLTTGVKVSRTGKFAYRSSRDFHAKASVKPGSFDVSGGMWKGLTLEVNGDNRAAIVFRGRSQGKDANTATEKQREAVKTLKGKNGERAKAVVLRRLNRGRKISNALKAASLRRSLGVNVLSLQGSEFEAVSVSVSELMKSGLDAGFSVEIDWNPTETGNADSGTVARILRAVRSNQAAGSV
jgi:hypothetical protein